jgi:hypothetical protein
MSVPPALHRRFVPVGSAEPPERLAKDKDQAFLHSPSRLAINLVVCLKQMVFFVSVLDF